jgi:outer membrane protein TolC
LPALVDLAWARSPQARQLEGDLAQASALSDNARAWFPGSPTLSFGQRSGERPGQRDLSEQDIALSAPLWAVGQRSALAQSADLQQQAAQAALAAGRLALAQQVQDQVDALMMAQLTATQAQARVDALIALERDVQRRVAAGELARTDALLMRQEVLAAQGDIRQARLTLIEAEHRFHVLVGEVRPELAPLPAPLHTADAELTRLMQSLHEAVEGHPRLLAARAALAQQQARQQVVQASGRLPLALGLSHRRERDADASRTNTSWGVSLSVPLFQEPGQARQLIAAQTEVDVAQTELSRTHDILANDLREAIQSLQHQRALLADAREAQDAARQRADLIRTSHRLGESSLADRLRAEQALHNMDSLLAQRQALVTQAQARLHFARGVQP